MQIIFLSSSLEEIILIVSNKEVNFQCGNWMTVSNTWKLFAHPKASVQCHW